MRLDASLAFVGLGGPLSLVAGASPTLYSDVVDLMGVGVGNAPPNIIGNATTFGEDPGIGMFRPELMIAMGSTAAAGGTSVNVQLQYAPDTASTYQPGTWATIVETGAILTASLTANQVIARFPWLPTFPANNLLRYLRLAFVEVGTFTAGAIAFAIPTLVRDDQANRYAAKNYTVA